MHDWRSLSHVRWECKYHVVFTPKYRKKSFYGRTRRRIGEILRDLCKQRGIELLEGHAMPDHIHVVLSIPPKYSVANTVGFLKGKSAVRIHREHNSQAGLSCQRPVLTGLPKATPSGRGSLLGTLQWLSGGTGRPALKSFRRQPLPSAGQPVHSYSPPHDDRFADQSPA